VGQSSEAKKLLGDQILKFGPDFVKTGELWSTYFGIFGKHPRSTTRHQNIVGQGLKTKSYEVSNFDDDSDFLEIGELWSTYFDVSGKSSGRVTSYQNFIINKIKSMSYWKKTKAGQHFLWGPVHNYKE